MPEKSPRTPELMPLQQRLQVVMDWGALGMWEVDLKTERVIWAARSDLMLGLPRGQEPADLNELLSFISPEDRARVELTLHRALTERWSTNEDKFRIVRTDGSVRDLTVYIHFLFSADGTPDRMIGVAQDVTEMTARDQERQDA